MATGGGFRGTSAAQDVRFSNKEKKLLKSMKFPKELDVKVDLSKVNMDVMKPWIAKRVTELLGGLEDEVLIGLVYNELEQKDVDPKQIQINLTGFLEKNTSLFMKELWTLLASAQQTKGGVPQQFLDEEAERIRKRREEQDKITAELQRQRESALAESAQARGNGAAPAIETSSAAPTEGHRASRWDRGGRNPEHQRRWDKLKDPDKSDVKEEPQDGEVGAKPETEGGRSGSPPVSKSPKQEEPSPRRARQADPSGEDLRDRGREDRGRRRGGSPSPPLQDRRRRSPWRRHQRSPSPQRHPRREWSPPRSERPRHDRSPTPPPPRRHTERAHRASPPPASRRTERSGRSPERRTPQKELDGDDSRMLSERREAGKRLRVDDGGASLSKEERKQLKKEKKERKRLKKEKKRLKKEREARQVSSSGEDSEDPKATGGDTDGDLRQKRIEEELRQKALEAMGSRGR